VRAAVFFPTFTDRLFLGLFRFLEVRSQEQLGGLSFLFCCWPLCPVWRREWGLNGSLCVMGLRWAFSGGM